MCAPHHRVAPAVGEPGFSCGLLLRDVRLPLTYLLTIVMGRIAEGGMR